MKEVIERMSNTNANDSVNIEPGMLAAYITMGNGFTSGNGKVRYD